jgi:DNA-nicking Smr family endonuclease
MSPRRGTSDEEHALFRSALKDAKALTKRARVLMIPPRTQRLAPAPRIEPPDYLSRPAPAIGGHRDAKLRRGRGEPEARLDLHGMTHDGAYRALMRFLMAAQSEDKRLVLVVTGKGGVLRGALPLWLGQKELEPVVSGISEAHIRHGGSGAFYVSLRRSKAARERT